ncbi:hypothetical protein B296_00027355 [Ensete ventricosum]|uniref:Uncharacterized protein n=1 Tax=Ensete ventricosum TaxID=4639 RepID=A0A426Z777_ENSVE|nr:hypothetical protein B296_00027355 [Ensete ventricosum]
MDHSGPNIANTKCKERGRKLGTEIGLKEEKRDGEGSKPGRRIGRRAAEGRRLGILAREAPSNLHDTDHGDGKTDELVGVWVGVGTMSEAGGGSCETICDRTVEIHRLGLRPRIEPDDLSAGLSSGIRPVLGIYVMGFGFSQRSALFLDTKPPGHLGVRLSLAFNQSTFGTPTPSFASFAGKALLIFRCFVRVCGVELEGGMYVKQHKPIKWDE